MMLSKNDNTYLIGEDMEADTAVRQMLEDPRPGHLVGMVFSLSVRYRHHDSYCVLLLTHRQI